MATLHVSEAEAIEDFGKLLAHVRAGCEVLIGSDDGTLAVLTPAGYSNGDQEHDAWFRAQVEEGLQSDRSGDIDGDELEQEFTKRREASRLRAQVVAG